MTYAGGLVGARPVGASLWKVENSWRMTMERRTLSWCKTGWRITVESCTLGGGGVGSSMLFIMESHMLAENVACI